MSSDDSSTGFVVGIAIWLTVVAMVVMAICSIGALIGAYYSIKNYIVSFTTFVHLRDPEPANEM